jgi:ABC-type multidrug transport system ATPase subunit
MSLIYAFGIENYTHGDGGIACALLFLLFGPAVAGFTYISSFLFTSHSTAQNIVLFQNFVTGLCLMITSFVLSLIDSTKEINMQLKWIYRLFPGFCLGDGLVQLTFCMKGKCPTYVDGGLSFAETQGPLKWDVTGADITYLAFEIVAYFLITWFIEYVRSFPSLIDCFSRLTVSDPGDQGDDEADDEDVALEKERVAMGDADGDVVVLKDLRKVYAASTGPKVAVKGLSFGIPNGECFGFLGINGAGKTTTLSILSGEFPPTSGTGYIGGFDIRGDQSLIRRKIGYCPQFDALLELLTVEEHLYLYARIKGMSERSLPGIVQGIMSDMDLLDFSNKAAGSLSGGNRRKLSVAIAMIGGPSIVFLDEPSTGMDPVARRFMWDVIANMSTREGKCSVILTTHSMEEAEALCSRIGIMVAGRLRCLGSGQHLKVRHGSGYEVDVKIDVVPASAVLDAFTLLARSSALPVNCFAEIPAHIAASLNGGKGESAIYKDETDAKNILINLSLCRVNLDNLKKLCMSLGKPQRFNQVHSQGSGSALYEMHMVTGTVQVESFLEWWILEDLFESLEGFFANEFDKARLTERSTLSSCRYSVADQGLSLPRIFGVLEKNKQRLGIQEYSVGQTTLEQIFNQFAGTTQNPENAE